MSPREWLGGFSKRFGGPVNAGVNFLVADQNQSLANRTLDAAASYGGWKAGAVAGGVIGSAVPVVGTGVGMTVGGLLGGLGATRAMDAFQEGVKNLPAPKSGGLLGVNEPLINKEAARRFDSSRSSIPPVPNPDIEQTGTTMGGFADIRGSISPGSPIAAPTNHSADLVHEGAAEWQQRVRNAGGDPSKAEVPELSKSYGSMTRQEMNDAYDRLRYGDNFDKARDYMKKGQSDPFDSTYNPSKLLVNEAGQKKAVEEGMKMHEAFFGPGGGRSREVSSPASQPSVAPESQTSFSPGFGRMSGSAALSTPEQRDRDLEAKRQSLQPIVKGAAQLIESGKIPGSTSGRGAGRKAFQKAQSRLQKNQVQRNLNQYSPVQYYTGDTGHSTGPHLDMRVWSHEKGAFVDPTEFMKYLSVGGKPVGDQFRMSSPYGMRDLYKNGNEKMHHGIDYATPEMTPIDVMGEYLTTYNDPGGGITSQYQIPGFDLILMHGHNKNKVLTPSYVTDGISRYGV